MQALCSGMESAHIRLNIFSFKIEETYTLTTFVDQKLSLSVYSKLTFDSLFDGNGKAINSTTHSV